MIGNKMMVQQLADSDAVEKMTRAIAEIERRQLRAACDLADAVGIDRPESLPPVDQRQQALQQLLVAIGTGSFGEFWAEEIGAERFDSTPPADLVAAGTDSDRWQQQIETWAEQVREQAGDVDATNRELAAIACREVYGADLDEFEHDVVDLDPGATANRLFSGNFEAARRLMKQATDEIATNSDLEEAGDTPNGE